MDTWTAKTRIATCLRSVPATPAKEETEIQMGTATLNVSASTTGTASVTFPVAFLTIPKVTTSGLSSQIDGETFVVQSITNITVNDFDVTYQCLSGSTVTGVASFDWTAVGE